MVITLSLLVVLVLVICGSSLIYFGVSRLYNRPDGILPADVIKVGRNCYTHWGYRYNVRESKNSPALYNVCLLGDAPNTIGKPDRWGYVRVLDTMGTNLFKGKTPDKSKFHWVLQQDLYPFYYNHPSDAQPAHRMLIFTLDSGKQYEVTCGVQVNPLDVIGIPDTEIFLRIPITGSGVSINIRCVSPYEPIGNVWWATLKN